MQITAGQATAARIMPCLWFDTQAEEAANAYVAIFEDARILRTSRYGENFGREAGSVMTVEFELAGQRFVALNGGPEFTFNEAVSFQILCTSQAEVDHYWAKLAEGGEERPCGWVKDRYGLSWQVVPTVLLDMVTDPDPEKAARVTKAFLRMRKFDIQALECAYQGTTDAER
jgi:predicted 3-demethylubiquinone-9 3-methyltransferase (glyoxalase superfamily)